MMVGAEPTTPDALDERAVGRGEGVGVAVDALGVPVLGGHPEVPLDGLGHAVGQLVVEDRPLARSSANRSSGKPFRHKAKSDRSTGVVVGMPRSSLAVTLT